MTVLSKKEEEPRLIEGQYVELDYQEWLEDTKALWDPRTGHWIDRDELCNDRRSVLWAFFVGAVAGGLLASLIWLLA